MHVVFLGGASQIGASCLAVETEGQWLLIDAGVRTSGGDPLPDLAFLQDKEVRAVFVTHAHSDHIGALPLVHAAFPTAPIYATRATTLLLDVMLADALTIMSRRAAEELEVPLYTDRQVESTLNALRPFPIDRPVAIPEVAGLTVTASLAGHIAGAVCLSLEAPDGTLVVSGDISITSQRTVAGASLPPLRHPDLLILESTYGATRLHPNRQAEEVRLAEAVAGVIMRGGHCLIPAFALGRAQEIVLILKAAQYAGQIPAFPIYLDGLVRRICSTYTLIPEALNPKLQRQLRRGQQPFSGPTIRMVSQPRDREKIVQGEPACIIASSGMLTGGPSAWFAARLAPREEAAILITGYQDEESPGRKLLALADGSSDTLEVDGQTVPVRCHIAKYALSAHADGTELTSFAAEIRPASVALVHGDDAARNTLAERLSRTTVHRPVEGQILEVHAARRQPVRARADDEALPALPHGIGQGRPLAPADLPELHGALMEADPDLTTITLRELARVWYGDAADGDAENALEQALRQQYHLFLPAEDVPGVYVLAQAEEAAPAEAAPDARIALQGKVVLLRPRLDHLVPALCQESMATGLRMLLPQGGGQRTRFAQTDILEILGRWPHEQDAAPEVVRAHLKEMTAAAKRYRQRTTRADLALALREGHTYDLREVCERLGVLPEDLVGVLAVAHMLNDSPGLIVRSSPQWQWGGPARYSLHPDWRLAMAQLAPPGQVYADAMTLQSSVDRHFAGIPDLYKRGTDPVTGAITLYFTFPDVAEQRYGDRIEALKRETGVPVTVYPHAHQQQLMARARAALPQTLRPLGTPSLFLDEHWVRVRCQGEADEEKLESAKQAFHEETGWYLDLVREKGAAPPPAPIAGGRLEQNAAITLIRNAFPPDAGLYKVGVEHHTHTLTLRFYFPQIAEQRYATLCAEMEQQTGWHIAIAPSAHAGELERAARLLLRAGVRLAGSPALYQHEHRLAIRYQGMLTEEELQQAQTAFQEQTGWTLELRQ